MREMLQQVRPDWSLADWALRLIWNQPEVGTVLSGMSAMDQVEENLRIAASPTDFGAREEEALATVRKWFDDHLAVNCTGCGYCLPCPKGVAIPDVFTYLNEYHMDDSPAVHERARMVYGIILPVEKNASQCVSCHACESRCPQNIAIAEKMAEAVTALGPTE